MGLRLRDLERGGPELMGTLLAPLAEIWLAETWGFGWGLWGDGPSLSKFSLILG